MIEKNVYCIDIITQTSAVKQALFGVEDALMENKWWLRVIGVAIIGEIIARIAGVL